MAADGSRLRYLVSGSIIRKKIDNDEDTLFGNNAKFQRIFLALKRNRTELEGDRTDSILQFELYTDAWKNTLQFTMQQVNKSGQSKHDSNVISQSEPGKKKMRSRAKRAGENVRNTVELVG